MELVISNMTKKDIPHKTELIKWAELTLNKIKKKKIIKY